MKLFSRFVNEIRNYFGENYINHYYTLLWYIALFFFKIILIHYSLLVDWFADFFYRSLNYFLAFLDVLNVLCRFVENCFKLIICEKIFFKYNTELILYNLLFIA